ncbi:hypothetical protein [Devosia sp. CN2-171]|uniref:hypothetical protein n=1 Tax=Devosia sp. CN2-171 TaxID=3400909 RepID=UPI003BF82D49
MWHDLKQIIVDGTGIEGSGLHVLIAVAVFFAVYLVTRRGGIAFAVAVAMQVLNEALDVAGDLLVRRDFRALEAIEDTSITALTAAILWGLVALMRRLSR